MVGYATQKTTLQGRRLGFGSIFQVRKGEREMMRMIWGYPPPTMPCEIIILGGGNSHIFVLFTPKIGGR